MDHGPPFGAQDVLRCHLCDMPVPTCESCGINLCKTCPGEHLLDETKEHRVLTFKQRGSILNYLKCSKNTSKLCELYCDECNIPVCSRCVSSKHQTHSLVDILTLLKSKKKNLQKRIKRVGKLLILNIKRWHLIF